MSFRTSILGPLDAVRGILGPTGLDMRTTLVTIRTRTWSGGRRGLGTTSDVDLVLPQHIKCRQLTTREIADSAGDYETGDMLIGPITPWNGVTGPGSVGFTEAQLDPPVATDGVEIIVLLTGAHKGGYTLVELRSTQPFRYEIVVSRRTVVPKVVTAGSGG